MLGGKEEELRRKVWLAMDLIDKEIFMHSEELVIEANATEYRIPLILGLAVINAIVGNGSMLLYGGYGYGKTMLLKYLGRVLTGLPLDYIESSILRANPQLTEEKIVGRLELGDLIKEGKETIVWRKFTKSFWKIIDEINRLSPAAQDVLLSLLGEGITKYFDDVYQSKYYVLYATLNPRDVGTFPMGLPVLDRFGIAVIVKSPKISDLERIFDTPDDRVLRKEIPAVLSIEDLVDIWAFVEAIELDYDAQLFIHVLFKEISLCDRVDKETGIMLSIGSKICLGCPFESLDTICKYTYTPLSIRAQRDLIRYSKALAWLLGLKRVSLGLVVTLAPYVIWHRLKFAEKYMEEYGYNKFLFAKKIVEKALKLFIKNLPILQAFEKLKFGHIDTKMITSIRKMRNLDLLVRYEVDPFVDILMEKEYINIAVKLEKALNNRDVKLVSDLLREADAKLKKEQVSMLKSAVFSWIRQNTLKVLVIPKSLLSDALEIIRSYFSIDISLPKDAPITIIKDIDFQRVELDVFSIRENSPVVLKLYTLEDEPYKAIINLGVNNNLVSKVESIQNNSRREN